MKKSRTRSSNGPTPRRKKPPIDRDAPENSAPGNLPPGEKLQKVLARTGLGSRRAIEDWIRDGRVSVNGAVAEIGARVGDADVVRVDGRRIELSPSRGALRVIIYHKPAGEVCTRADPEGRATVFENLPRLRRGRWVAVGRLDVATSGLLLFTNEGELANRLMHPSAGIEREYAVRVRGEAGPELLARLGEGVRLEDGMARFESVTHGGGEGVNQWFHVVLTEGRNREVRRLWESQGLSVSRLIRVRYGCVNLPKGLPAGRFADLEDTEIDALCDMAGYERSESTPPARRSRKRSTRPRRVRKRTSGRKT